MFFPAEILTRMLTNLSEADLETASFASKTWRACAKQAHIENRRHDVRCKISQSESTNFRRHDVVQGALGPVIVYRAHNRVAIRDPAAKSVTLNDVIYPVTCIFARYIFGTHYMIELTSDKRYGAYIYALYLNSSTSKFVVPPFIEKLLSSLTRRTSNPDWKIEDESVLYGGLRVFYATKSTKILAESISSVNWFALNRLETQVKRSKNMLLSLMQMEAEMTGKASLRLQEVMTILAGSDPKIQEDLALLRCFGIFTNDLATISVKVLSDRLNEVTQEQMLNLESWKP